MHASFSIRTIPVEHNFSMIKSIALIIASYHVGIPNFRVGAGPKRILERGLVEQLTDLGIDVKVTAIAAVDDFEGEIGRSFELMRRIASKVASALRNNHFPIVLAGNCNVEVGVAAGMGQTQDFEVIWFDAHSDFDTPDEALSGYFDGRGVSMLAGESWKALMATVSGHRPVLLDRFIFCGVRDLSDAQVRKLRLSPAKVVWGGERSEKYAHSFGRTLGDKSNSACLVHLDLDCLDISIGEANEYAAPGGMSEEDLTECL